MKLLLKILGVFIVIILLIIGGGFYSLFYTALPAKTALKFLQSSDSNWTFNDISGSLSKGFSVGSLTYKRPEDPTKVSEIKNIGFEYEKSSDSIVIKEFHIDSAYLYIDPKGGNGQLTYTKTTAQKGAGNNNGNYDNSGEHDVEYPASEETERYNDQGGVVEKKEKTFFDRWTSKKWVLKSVKIKDLTIEDPTTNEKTYIKEIQSDGAVFSDGKLLFGKLLVESNNLDFTINPFGGLNDDNMGSVASIKGRVGKKLYWKLKKDINFSGFIDLTTFPGTVNSFNGLNGAIQIINETDETQRVLVKQFSFDEYIQEESVPPLKKLNLEAVYHLKDGQKEALEIKGGDFTLGNAFFTLEKGTIDLSDDASKNQELLAHASSEGVDYTIRITSDGKTKLHFDSKPAMEQGEILSKLLYGKKFSMVNSEEKTGIENYLR